MSASTVIERSASLLPPYGMISHAICENVTQYTGLKDSLRLTYSKELFSHGYCHSIGLFMFSGFIYYSELFLIVLHL